MSCWNTPSAIEPCRSESRRSRFNAVRSRIRIHADINLDLPAVVVSDTAMQGHTPAAEIVLECGKARLFTGDGKGSGGGSWRGEELGAALPPPPEGQLRAQHLRRELPAEVAAIGRPLLGRVVGVAPRAGTSA